MQILKNIILHAFNHDKYVNLITVTFTINILGQTKTLWILQHNLIKLKIIDSFQWHALTNKS